VRAYTKPLRQQAFIPQTRNEPSPQNRIFPARSSLAIRLTEEVPPNRSAIFGARCEEFIVGATYPETSFTISLTNAVLLLKWPLVREMRGLDSRGVTFCYRTFFDQLLSV